MKNLHTYEEFLNEASSFDTKRTKHIKFILGSVMPYKDKSFYFNFRKGTDEKEIEEILKSAEKGNRDIAKIARKYGKNPTSGDTVLELSNLNYSGLTWIFKELDNLYGQKGSGMGWYGEIEESINESTLNRFQPVVLDRTNQIDERIFKKLMPRTEKTSEEAMERIWTFEGNTMFAHYQYHIVKPNGNKPDRPTYRLHDSQYWLNDTQMKMQGRDPKEKVNVTLVTVYDITDPMKEQNLGKIWVDTDAYLDEIKRVFELIKHAS